jgi:hypothetical protein
VLCVCVVCVRGGLRVVAWCLVWCVRGVCVCEVVWCVTCCGVVWCVCGVKVGVVWWCAGACVVWCWVLVFTEHVCGGVV